MSLREKDLIRRSKAGDVEAFSALVRRHEDKIHRLAKNVCAGLPAEADDVYQETFLTAFKKIGGFRADADLSTWLYRIASNLCWMRFRKRKSEPVVPLPEGRQVRDRGLAPEEAARKAELRKAVVGALAQLPVELRLVVTLRDIEALSGEKTARVLGLSVAAVKSRLHRGRLLLRDRFAAAMGACARPGLRRATR